MPPRLRSLRAHLLALWILLLASAAATAYLLTEFYTQSAAVQVAQAELQVARACREIGDRFAFFSAGWSGSVAQVDDTLKGQLTDVVVTALAAHPGVEGGIWTAAGGSAAYAFPTYEGTGPKTDLPAAELDTIRRVNAETLSGGRPVTTRRVARTQTLVVQGCPLRGPIQGATAWTMARVYTDQGRAYGQLLAGFGFLAATVLGSALLLGRLLLLLGRRIARLEGQLGRDADEGGVPHEGELPRLAPTGLRELDRLVEALNAAGARLAAARRRAAEAERLAALGQLAAGIAHEIRNPLAAIRLKAENALASADPARPRAALDLVLVQVARMDRLLRDLLSLTQKRAPALAPTDLAAVLAESAHLHDDLARAQGVRIAVAEAPRERPRLDEAQLRRALDNLLLNAIQHSPAGGVVRLSAEVAGERLRIRVTDQGPGVPASLRERLFEPFVTGRPDGTGLGLALVREIARAHGGQVRLAAPPPDGPGSGATFELDLPWSLP
ncbi:sensor histidine kinase [Methylobacterium nonmethylotrophicum]|uniref:histidine kinase n=1 Tax=Methylobacterium nonmethylotrophicum TaxID=1141884 RepID=A0A4Z0NEA9_9HYPH|nr:HAMP domain-containing sensor histidine kinase [Methylobacterium nonmethylotrophicum]TGD93433.1 HAMP domain-containing histidine kinase [Methylobacterium nonmethylotrophicum]